PMTEEATSLDRWTIAAIAALAWPLADMLHEGGGHGGTALLLGVKASALTSAYYQYADGAATVQQARLIAAGGAVLNVIVGLPMVALSRARLPSRLRFFVWLFAAYNLLTAFGSTSWRRRRCSGRGCGRSSAPAPIARRARARSRSCPTSPAASRRCCRARSIRSACASC